ncbi:MAG: deoxyribodipyrimidine photo-lyase [Bacteroidales bacterium]|nr:deoxyribodipyrimidine photo-lyase [Bacteroidales bacterium]
MNRSHQKIVVFWFRRDLRLDDNVGLNKALGHGLPVLPLFLFDDQIISELPEDDARITFLYDRLKNMNQQLKMHDSSLLCLKGKPEELWTKLLQERNIAAVYCNEDYEPYARERDDKVKKILEQQGATFHQFKDQVVFAKEEVLKDDGKPYTVYTPYMKKWRTAFQNHPPIATALPKTPIFLSVDYQLPSLESIGFKRSPIHAEAYRLNKLENYRERRDFPALDQTSKLSVHLRFGTVSIRKVVQQVQNNESFLNELIWREFFMQILYHFPKVVAHNFHAKYDGIQWRNKNDEFERWKKGMTGYPLVDAGMRELNATGNMHNRVRMVTAGFLVKHLLIDWRWGEAYFALKLLDYDLAANNGNWQWSAGTGCDAAPYFRVFNPLSQLDKFDKDRAYVKKWIPELDTAAYPKPMVDHKTARLRAIKTYNEALGK